jgi:hypothetical protein
MKKYATSQERTTGDRVVLAEHLRRQLEEEMELADYDNNVMSPFQESPFQEWMDRQ